MTLGRLLLRNLFYHWRGNFAVLLGVAVGTAVLAGALFVGDSLRGSLHDRVVQRLGWVDHALVANRFFREELAVQLSAEKKSRVILLQGSISTVPKNSVGSGVQEPARRLGRVTILDGADEEFRSWILTLGKQDYGNGWIDKLFLYKLRGARPDRSFKLVGARVAGDAILSAAVARELGVDEGRKIVLHLPKVSTVPRESLLGRTEAGQIVEDVTLRVGMVLSEDDFGSRFSLTGNPDPPRNVYVQFSALQEKLGQQGRINAILTGGSRVADLQDELRQHLDLEDWGLVLRDPSGRTRELFVKYGSADTPAIRRTRLEGRFAQTFLEDADVNHDGELTRDEILRYYRSQHNYLSLESRQTFIEPAVEKAALQAAKELHLRPVPTFLYLADSISAGGQEVPYSIVAALDPTLPAPLGPFLPAGAKELRDDEIVLVEGTDEGKWKLPLHVKPGDEITLSYYSPEEQGKLTLRKQTFRLRGIIPLQGPAADPDLTPEFPGVTDQLKISEWKNPPFPYVSTRVRASDESFWRWYRTTPKAYITLAKGQELWGSRFGKLTSIRFAPEDWKADTDLSDTAEAFHQRLRSHLRPEDGGFVFDPVLERGLQSAAGGTDFSGLFLGFSIFLIVAALLLVGLLFRLNIDRRAEEIGLLLAAGYRRGTVRWLLLAEGGLLSAAGGLVGLAGGLLYAWLMLELLRSWWPGSLDRSFLHLHASAQSFLIGYCASLVVSILTILWAVRALGRTNPRALLNGQTTEENEPGTAGRRPLVIWLVAGFAAIMALALLTLGWLVQDHEMQASSFFGGGSLLLTASLAAVWVWMRKEASGRVVSGSEGVSGGVVSGEWSTDTTHPSPLTTHHSPLTPHHSPLTTSLAALGIRNAARHAVRSLLTIGLLASAAFVLIAVQSFHREPSKDLGDHHSSAGGFLLAAETDVPVYLDLNSEKGRFDLLAQLKLRLQDQRMDSTQIGVELRKAEETLKAVHIYPMRLRAGDDTSCLNLSQPRRPRLLGVPHEQIERDGFRFSASSALAGVESQHPWLLLEKPGDDGTIPAFVDATTAQWVLHKGLGDTLELPDEKGNNAPCASLACCRAAYSRAKCSCRRRISSPCIPVNRATITSSWIRPPNRRRR